MTTSQVRWGLSKTGATRHLVGGDTYKATWHADSDAVAQCGVALSSPYDTLNPTLPACRRCLRRRDVRPHQDGHHGTYAADDAAFLPPAGAP